MNQTKKTGKLTAIILAVVMLISMIPLQGFASTPDEKLQLKNGTAVITSEMSNEEVKEALFKALVSNQEGKDAQSLEWEYYCQGKNGLLKNDAWGSVNGFTSKKLLTNYSHPALKDNASGKYSIRLAGDESTQVTVTKKSSADEIQDLEIILKENPEKVLLHLNDALATDFNRFREDRLNAVYDAEKSLPGDLKWEDVKFEYDASRLETIPIWHELEFVDTTDVQRALDDGGVFRFRMTTPQTAQYYSTTVEFKATVEVAQRIESSLTLTNVSYTYTSDCNALRESIFNSLIDWNTSVLPSKEAISKDFFTIEYYGENLVLGKPGGIKKWVPLEGGKIDLLDYPAIGAGEHQIRVTFKGNSTHTGAVAEQTVTINKAKAKITVHSTDKYADERFPDDFITINSNDPFQIYTVYLGTTSSVTAALFVDLPDDVTESFLIDLLNPIVKLVVGRSLDDIIANGITIDEINAVINSKELKDLIATFKIDLGVIGKILNIIDNLPSSIKQIRVGFDEPNVAGSYNIVAIGINPNYETAVGLGIALVKMRYSTVKLEFNQNVENGKIAAADAANFDFTATLSYQGVPVNGNVKYLYTGVKKNGAPFTSTNTPPSEPGFYTQTVITFGGNYQAAPITRSFNIV